MTGRPSRCSAERATDREVGVVAGSERVVVFDLDGGSGAERPWRDRMLDLVAELPALNLGDRDRA